MTTGVGYDLKELKATIYECLVDGLEPKRRSWRRTLRICFLLPSNIDLWEPSWRCWISRRRRVSWRRSVGKGERWLRLYFNRLFAFIGFVDREFIGRGQFGDPVQCQYFALEGLGKLLNTIKIIQKRLNTALEIEGFVLTMYDGRVRLSNQVVAEVRKHFEEMVFDTLIQQNVKLAEAPSYGQPVILYDAECRVPWIIWVWQTNCWRKKKIV